MIEREILDECNIPRQPNVNEQIIRRVCYQFLLPQRQQISHRLCNICGVSKLLSELEQKLLAFNSSRNRANSADRTVVRLAAEIKHNVRNTIWRQTGSRNRAPRAVRTWRQTGGRMRAWLRDSLTADWQHHANTPCCQHLMSDRRQN